MPPGLMSGRIAGLPLTPQVPNFARCQCRLHRSPKSSPDVGRLLELAHLVRGSLLGSTYSRLIGPTAVTCVTYSPDFAQWKGRVPPGRTTTGPGGEGRRLSFSN